MKTAENMLNQQQSQILQTQSQMTSQQSALLQAITDMMNHMTTIGAGTGSSIPFAMPSKTVTYRNGILDSKAVMNLKTLESDTSTFRNWKDKLVNAMSQAIEYSREAMEWTMKMNSKM